MATSLPIRHYLFSFLILGLTCRYYRLLRTLFYHTFRSKMLFFKTLYNTLSLNFWHIVKTLIFYVFLCFICKRSVFYAAYWSVLTFINLYVWEIHIRPFFFPFLNRQNLFIFLSFRFKRANSINALLNFFFERVNIYNMFFWMINSKPSHISQYWIIVYKHLDFS